jgi:hypothetical protein
MTQQEQVLSHLQAGHTITPLEAFTQFGITRLAARVHELQERGYTIEAHAEKHGNKRYARYSMPTVFKSGDVVQAVSDSRSGTHYHIGCEARVVEVGRGGGGIRVRTPRRCCGGGAEFWTSAANWKRIDGFSKWVVAK